MSDFHRSMRRKAEERAEDRVNCQWLEENKGTIDGALIENQSLKAEVKRWQEVVVAIEKMDGSKLNSQNYPLAVGSSWALLHMENQSLRELLREAREMISSHEQLCGCQEQEECIKRIDAALGEKK